MAEDARAGAGSEVITEEQLRKAEEYVQQEEGAANRLSGWVGIVVTGIAVAMTLFHLYAAYDIVPTIPLRYTHVAFVLLLSFLLFPLSARFRNRIQWFDVIPPLLGIATIVYALAQGDDFTDRAAVPEKWDVILGAIFIVLVLEAARRTQGILADPPSYVIQAALSDFYVEYKLVAYAGPEAPSQRALVISDLNANVQDVFNEYGVQIMSPNYVLDPASPKVVAKQNWFAAPSEPGK